MTTILVGELKQETSTFNPIATHYADFDVERGEAILRYHRGLNTEMAGALEVFATQPELQVAASYSARARTSGGTITAQADQRLLREFTEALRGAPAVDAVYLSLHGAMSAQEEPDPEGRLLEEVRKILGEEIPIVVSMDLHGILTERILQCADAVVVYHTYPHVDFATTGQRAARLLLKILAGESRPVTAVAPIPALVRGNELITESGLLGEMIRHAQRVESGPRGLSAGMFIGNPFTDVPDLRSNSLVVTDGDEALARREALQLAEQFWQVHERLQQPLISVQEAVAIASRTQGCVILTDAADATSSGASGDSNVLLAALLQQSYAGRALAPIVDAGAVQAAMAAGVGARIETTIGGRLDPARFTPLPVTATVRMLTDGRFISESNGAVWNSGPTAVLAIEEHIVIATSLPVSLYDRSLFYACGQDPERFDAVVVKSPHCQPHMFAEWAAKVLNVDAPGSTSANLRSLGHTQCRRPIFPLDTDLTFEAQARIYQRPR